MSTDLTIFYKIQVSDWNNNLYNDYYYFCSKLVYKVLDFIMIFPNTVCFVEQPPLLLIPPPTPLYPSLSVALFHVASHMYSITPSLLSLKSPFPSCGALSSLMTIPFMSWLRQSTHSDPAVHSLDSELLRCRQHLLAVCHEEGCKVQSVDVVCSESRCQWIFLMQHK